jgi:hypothetical protein
MSLNKYTEELLNIIKDELDIATNEENEFVDENEKIESIIFFFLSILDNMSLYEHDIEIYVKDKDTKERIKIESILSDEFFKLLT